MPRLSGLLNLLGLVYVTLPVPALVARHAAAAAARNPRPGGRAVPRARLAWRAAADVCGYL
jgi:hypothetical protein